MTYDEAMTLVRAAITAEIDELVAEGGMVDEDTLRATAFARMWSSLSDDELRAIDQALTVAAVEEGRESPGDLAARMSRPIEPANRQWAPAQQSRNSPPPEPSGP